MMRRYILTGATGVVGSAVLQRLVNAREKTIILIRAGSDDHLRQRTKALFRYCRFSGSARSLIQPVKADLIRPDLGLAGQDYDFLVRHATHMIHCAGNVTMNLPMGTALEQTMRMTRNIISLMESAGQIRKTEYVSTVGVAGDTPGPVREEWMLHERSFRNSYEAAKAEAEHFIREKRSQGRNITLHRPSMVIGNAATGETIRFQVFYYLCEFLSGARTLGLLPDLSGVFLDVVPSDYVAELIYRASLETDNSPDVLHACSGPEHQLGLNDLARRVRTLYKDSGFQVPGPIMLPTGLFQALFRLTAIFAPPKTRRSLGTLPLFLKYLKTPQHFINTRARELAEQAGVRLPDAMTCALRSLGYYLDHKKNPGHPRRLPGKRRSHEIVYPRI